MRILIGVLITAAIISSCAKNENPGATDSGKTKSADSMASMPGMSGAATSSGSVAQQMEAHLVMMRGLGPDSMKAVLPAHRQMAANAIASFNKEMRDMNMSADAAWSATVDSLRADLRTLPDLTPTQLQARMPDHEARLRRLIQMHQTMMKNMKM